MLCLKCTILISHYGVQTHRTRHVSCGLGLIVIIERFREITICRCFSSKTCSACVNACCFSSSKSVLPVSFQLSSLFYLQSPCQKIRFNKTTGNIQFILRFYKPFFIWYWLLFFPVIYSHRSANNLVSEL